MNRWTTYLAGPETVLAIITMLIFGICARHNSGEGRDVELMEKLVTGLAFWVVPLVFATVFVPGSKNWWWLGRAVMFTSVMLLVMAGKLISGFGTGSKGQDAGFIMVMVFGVFMVAVCSAIAGAMILSETKPAFGSWFSNHKFVGSLLVLVAMVPIGFLLGIIQSVGVGIFLSAWSAFKR
jgi:hypothetical protein